MQAWLITITVEVELNFCSFCLQYLFLISTFVLISSIFISLEGGIFFLILASAIKFSKAIISSQDSETLFIFQETNMFHPSPRLTENKFEKREKTIHVPHEKGILIPKNFFRFPSSKTDIIEERKRKRGEKEGT